MKTLLIAFFILLPWISYSQVPKQKLSRDSISYYRKQLTELSKASYDSLVNSPRYKELHDKATLNGKQLADYFGVELSIFTGFQKNDYTNLNARLVSLNVKKRNSFMCPLGVGLAFRFGKLVVGYDMTPVLIGDNSTGAAIHGFVSTNMIRTKKWIFSPQFGYGGQNIKMRIQTESSSSNFNSYFTTSANEVEIYHSSSFLDVAMAFKLYQKGRDTYIPLLRIGYRYGLKDKMWKVNKGESDGAPSDRNNNFYLQVMLGFGS